MLAKLMHYSKDSCHIAVVVLSTAWLSWLQTSMRDGGYGRLFVVLKINCIRKLEMQHPNVHLTTTTD